MIPNFMSSRHPGINCNILFYPQYQNDEGQVICYPGSVFEGIVQIKITEPIPVHHIKLVFKASERVNYDAMGWEKSKEDDNRLFAVRTMLWGLTTHIRLPETRWPILSAGEHHFPFVLQMPVINFPPTFQHHLIATAFHMFVSVQKAGEPMPIVSKPWPITFQPIVETIPIKNLQAFTEETKLTHHVSTIVSVPRLAYNIYDKNQSIPVTVQFQSDNNNDENVNISQLRVYIKRYYGISYKSFSRNEATVITQYDHPKLPTTCPSTMTMKLRIPESSLEEDNMLPATLNYSAHLSIEYKLVVLVKIRHGPIQIKKKLFEMPVIFGTLPAGTRAPRQLESYSNIIDNRSVIHSRPTFLKPEKEVNEQEEFLPAYDNRMPPAYRCSSTTNLRIGITI